MESKQQGKADEGGCRVGRFSYWSLMGNNKKKGRRRRIKRKRWEEDRYLLMEESHHQNRGKSWSLTKLHGVLTMGEEPSRRVWGRRPVVGFKTYKSLFLFIDSSIHVNLPYIDSNIQNKRSFEKPKHPKTWVWVFYKSLFLFINSSIHVNSPYIDSNIQNKRSF